MPIRDFLREEKKREEKGKNKIFQFFALGVAVIALLSSPLFQRKDYNGLDYEDEGR